LLSNGSAALVTGHGEIVAEFFDAGESRTLARARRLQAAALVATLRWLFAPAMVSA
jgi:hypothetical protein